ncbi:MAG: AAA family ATPase [Planctomycetota bacterium]
MRRMIRKSPPAAELTRRVAEAQPKDVGRAIARLDPSDLRELGLATGDTVEVVGARTTVCRALPTRKSDRSAGSVHIDGMTRENARVGVDAEVAIRPVPCPRAERVVLEPEARRPDGKELAYIASLLDGLPVSSGDRVRVNTFGNRPMHFRVKRTMPDTACVVASSTALELVGGSSSSSRAKRDAPAATPASVSYEDVGGLGKQVHRIRETIELPLRFPEVFDRLGIDPPKGVLLHGPPGCGKTLIARAIAHETNANFFVISGPEIVHKHYGESEANLRKVWAEATRQGPSIVFIDEIDSIAPKREQTQGEVEKRIVATLLTLMDGLEARRGVVVLAATNLPNNLDPALRRPGRFDREIEIPVPDAIGRGEILDVHTRGMPLAADVDLDRVAQITHGCVGADLESLCREAAMHCLRQIMGEIDFVTGDVPYEKLASLTVSMNDFVAAFAEVTPSALREVFVETPRVSWDDVGGLEDVKAKLVESVDWPVRHAALFEEAKLRPPRGVMLAGPPGVGKTLIAKATASQLGANFISVKGPELLSQFVGESERAMREVFRKARLASPCVIFLDEADALLPKRSGSATDGGVRERVAAQFLTEMDGIEELRGVLVLAATNRLDIIDPAALRPGRFDHVIELGLPTPVDRERIFAVHLRDRPTGTAVTAEVLAELAGDVSGAEIAGVCDRAAMLAVRDSVSGGAPIRMTLEHFRGAMRDILGVEIES